MCNLNAGHMPDESGALTAQAPLCAPKFKYHAFLSYSHQDIRVVKAIQEYMEDYSLPVSPGTPVTRTQIYRDATDIRTGHLSDQLNSALLESACLIVCVSPSALQSRWVKEEVEAFRAVRPEAIIPVLLQGEPSDVATLVGFESRYADLTQHRSGATRFKAHEQIELVRVLAQVAGRDVRTLVPWHEERRRRRLATAVAGGLAVTLLLAGSGAGYFLQRQAAQVAAANALIQQAKAEQEAERAQREAQQRAEAVARKQGDGALASLSSNFFAQAAEGLARLDASAALLDGGRYAQAARFLLPRLMTFSEAATSVGRGQVVRWGDSNLVRGPDGKLREIPGAVLERVWFSPKGTELLAVDVARRVSRVAWPAMTVRGPHALGAVRVDSVAWAANGRVSLRATEIWLASDEETEDAQVNGDVVRIDLGADAKPLPPVKIPSDAAGNSSMGASRTPIVERPTARLEFPRLRDERSFWRTAEPRLPDDKRTIVPMAVRIQPPYRALNFKAIKGDAAAQRDFLKRAMNTEPLTSGMAELDGRHLALAAVITGNQGASFMVCDFDPATRVAAWCHIEDVTTTVRSYFSLDYRFMLLTMTEVQEDAFRLLDLSAGGARCKISAHPAERALQAAFDPTGSRLAVLTRDGEMWVYDVRKQPCEATVAVRFAPPDRGGRGGVIAFAGPDTLIWLTDGSYVHAFDAASGLVIWSQEGGARRGAQGTRSVSISPDGRMFAITIDAVVELRSALTGVALSGPFSVFKKAPGVEARGEVCEVAVDNHGGVRVEFDRESICSHDAIPQLRKGRAAWSRLAPDDPALKFGATTELWRRTAISDDDGKSPVPLGRLLAPSPTDRR
mgnify:CR=1 FL=1|jgi:hypothetical protein